MKYIESVVLKNKRFKIYKINQFEVLIFKKLHLEIIKDVPKEFDSPYNYSRYKEDIKLGNDLIFLMYSGKIPIAYSRISFRKIDSKNTDGLVKHYGVNKKELSKVCEIDGAGVIPKFRGYGIQDYFLKFRENYVKKEHYKFLFTATHPKNKYSLRNILKNGYKKQKVYKNHKGIDRLLFKKEV